MSTSPVVIPRTPPYPPPDTDNEELPTQYRPGDDGLNLQDSQGEDGMHGRGSSIDEGKSRSPSRSPGEWRSDDDARRRRSLDDRSRSGGSVNDGEDRRKISLNGEFHTGF